MSKLTQSYAHGVSMTPLIGETIGVHFDKMAARFADRDALIVRQQNIHWTYGELKEKTDALAAGLLALGLIPGDRVGIWSPNNAEWAITQFATAKAGLILVNINPAYRLAELDYALNKVGCKALITADSFKTSDYVGMLRELAPEIERSTPGRLQSKRLPALTTLIRIGDDEKRGLSALCRRARHGRRAPSRPNHRTCRHAAIRRSDQHPVHQRHHRRAERRDADPPQHPQQRLFHRRGAAAFRPRPRLHSGAALSLLRHGARQSRLHHPRRRHGLSFRRIRSARDAASGRSRALHRALRRTDNVHCRARPSRISTASIFRRCAPASWPARPARSK